MAILLAAQGTIRDIDVYWHILAGAELAGGLWPPSEVGADWSFAPAPVPWTSTQWLSETALHAVHALGGWPAVAAFRVVSASAIIGVLALTTLRGRPAVLAGLPWAPVVLAIGLYSQERAQQITYLGAALLGGLLVRGLISGRLPHWWTVLPLTVIWANLHGGWILLPGVFIMIAVGRLLDRGGLDGVAIQALALSALGLIAGVVSPGGLDNVTALARFSEATESINEWQAVTPTAGPGLLTILLWVLIAAAWTRPVRIPRSEVFVVVVLFIVAWSAWRHLLVSALLVTPVVASALVRAYPRIGARPEPRWSAPLAVGIGAACLVGSLAWLPTRQHLPVDEWPISLAGDVADLPGRQRLLNDYNVAGIVLFFGGDRVAVGIDGRTDRYGGEYIETYLDLTRLEGEWQTLLDELSPTSALLREGSPLAHVLVAERGWREVGSENGFVLLSEPA